MIPMFPLPSSPTSPASPTSPTSPKAIAVYLVNLHVNLALVMIRDSYLLDVRSCHTVCRPFHTVCVQNMGVVCLQLQRNEHGDAIREHLEGNHAEGPTIHKRCEEKQAKSKTETFKSSTTF